MMIHELTHPDAELNYNPTALILAFLPLFQIDSVNYESLE